MKKIVLRTALFEFILAVVFAAFMAFGVSAETVGGDCGASGSNLQWSIDTQTGELTITGTGAMKDWPTVNAPWYTSRSWIRSVTINGNVTSIGDYAFYDCSSLTSVTIPDSVTSIGSAAFCGCIRLTSITIPDSVTSIGDSALSNCSSLTSITIPDSVTSIGDYAFYDCSSLTSVTIPDSVTSIGDSAFSGCTGLTSITIPDSVTSIGDSTFFCCRRLTSITIPDNVTSIGDNAFDDCSSLTSITVGKGNSVYHSTDNCLIEASSKTLIAGCKNSIIPSDGSVTSIGDSAFSGCTELTSITIPDSVTSIGDSAFSGCTGLTSITIPDSVTSIGRKAFYDCSSLTSVTIPDSVTSIGSAAFCGCIRLTSITIPDSVTIIGGDAFCACSALTSVTIPDSVTFIGSHAFDNCSSLASVTIPDSVTSIGDYAFFGCSRLTSITIPASVTRIGDSAFGNCENLMSVTICLKTCKFGSRAFSGCYKLIEINNLSSLYIKPGSIENGHIAYYARNIYTPTSGESKLFYTEDGFVFYRDENGTYLMGYIGDQTDLVLPEIGKEYTMYDYAFCEHFDLTSITIPGSVTRVSEFAFNNCKGLTSVTILDGVTSIGSSSFSGCTSLTSVTIPDSVTSIGSSAFRDCIGLTSVTILNSVTSIGSLAFYGCENIEEANVSTTVISFIPKAKLKTVTINGGESIKDSAFYDWTWLTSVTISDSVTSIGNSAFYGCTGLTSVTMPDSVTSIGDYAFKGCSSLTSVTMPDSVTSIGKRAFYGCTGLMSVTIPGSVTSIGDYAFSQCVNMMSVTFYPDVWNIGNYAFYECYKLIEINNFSSLYIVPGSTANGYIAYYAQNVYIPTSGERKLKYTEDGFVFYRDENGTYLMGYVGDQTDLTVPDIDEEYSVYNYAFYGRSDLTSITLSDGVTSIGDNAFCGCTGLTSVTMPDSVASIGSLAFYGCTGLASVTIPDGVTSIGGSAFSGCTGLMSVTIPDSVTSIGGSAFSGCTGLTSITLPFAGSSSSENWSSYTNFGYIFGASSYSENNIFVPSSLKTVVINSDADIDDFAFYGCDGLTSIIFEYAANVIDDSAYVIYSGTTIYGYKNSSAEAYADKYGRKFVEIVCEHAASEDWVIDEEPSCTEDGKKHINCKKCREILEEAAIPAIGHDYVEPIYTWIGDQCIAECVCTHDTNHVETETVTAVYVKDTDATCTVNEYGHYEAKFTNAAFVKQATAANRIEKSNSKLGHSFTNYVSDGNATCTEDGTKTAKCDHGCGETDTVTDTGSRLEHEYGEWSETKAPTCVDKGIETRSCKNCTHSESRVIPETGIHTPASPVRENEVAATASADGSYDEVVYCSVCHAELSRTHCVVPAIDETIRGDVNGDGKVNSADAVYLLRHTMRPTKYPINQSGDMNGDDKVNSADAVYLLRYTMRPSKYPLADDPKKKKTA